MRRSKKVSMTLTTGVVVVALAGCSPETVDISTFTSADQCAAMGNPLEACETSFALAQQNHAEAAPRFQTLSDCELEFGKEGCEVALPPQQAEGEQPQQQQASGGGGLFMPLMLGYMMGSALSGPRNVAPQPLYRHRSGQFTTPTGTSVGQSLGGTRTVTRDAARATRTAQTMSRGGFGANLSRGVTSSRGYGSGSGGLG